MKLSTNQKIGIAGILVTIIVAVPVIYLAYLQDFPPVKRSINVTVSPLASASFVMGSNNSVTPGSPPQYGFIFGGCNCQSHYPVTVVNTGNNVIILTQIIMYTNLTGAGRGPQVLAITGSDGPVSPQQSEVFYFPVNAYYFPVGDLIKCTFTVTGDNGVSGKASIILDVIQNSS